MTFVILAEFEKQKAKEKSFCSGPPAEFRHNCETLSSVLIMAKGGGEEGEGVIDDCNGWLNLQITMSSPVPTFILLMHPVQ